MSLQREAEKGFSQDQAREPWEVRKVKEEKRKQEGDRRRGREAVGADVSTREERYHGSVRMLHRTQGP